MSRDSVVDWRKEILRRGWQSLLVGELADQAEELVAQVAYDMRINGARATPEVYELLERILMLSRNEGKALYALWSKMEGSPAAEGVEMRKTAARAIVVALASGLTAVDLEEELDRRTRKPGQRDRDRGIVRLHDEEKLSYGQIAMRLRMTKDAVIKAYGREKRRGRGP